MSSSDDIRTSRTIIPAAPGWFVAKFYEGDEDLEPFFDCHPIVAWEIEHGEVGRHRYRLAVPVLPYGLSDGFETFKCGPGVDWALKSPDGKYRIAGEEKCEVLGTKAAALAWFVAQHKERGGDCGAVAADPPRGFVGDDAIYRIVNTVIAAVTPALSVAAAAGMNEGRRLLARVHRGLISQIEFHNALLEATHEAMVEGDVANKVNSAIREAVAAERAAPTPSGARLPDLSSPAT
jgi:hypothetical protein